MFQFCETSSLKLTFSPLVMLFTMDDRQRRLEDAEDSLVPENQGNSVLFIHPFIYLFIADHTCSFPHVPSLWFIMAAVEWSAEVDQVSEAFFQ